MKKFIRNDNLLAIVSYILVMAMLIMMAPMSASAQMPSNARTAYIETSKTAPERLSANVYDGVISLYMHDDRVSNQVRTVYNLRDSGNTTLRRGDVYFTNGYCNLSVDVSGLDDGMYSLLLWECDESANYLYFTNIPVEISGGTAQFYSVNGTGEQGFLDYVNVNCNPDNYRGYSKWAQTAGNYDGIAAMARSITAGCNNDEEKVRAIHDWMCVNLAYDYEHYYGGDINNAADASWVFNSRRGVCSGFSRLANIMITAVGVPCMNISGYANNVYEGTDYPNTNHEWNLIYYNGSWHIFDITHDCQNAYYGSGNSDNVSGVQPRYNNYDASPFAFGTYHMSMKITDNSDDGYGEVVYRLFNRSTGEHLYTFSYDEAVMLWNIGWRYEGYAWKSPLRSNTPVYRVYNPVSGEHHYTTSAYEKDLLCLGGWYYEGIAWYSDDKLRVPTYRLYNPNVPSAGSHHYTTSELERDSLIWSGWIYEGIGWYGV